MKLSKKARIGIMALIYIEAHKAEGHVALATIAEKANISQQYLEQTITGLRRADIVTGIKGAQGGYELNRDAKDITVADIIKAIEGDYHLDAENAPKGSVVPEIADVVQESVIEKANNSLDAAFEGVTLEELVSDYKKRSLANEPMYYI